MTPAAIRLATPADAAAIAQVRVASWRTTYRGMIPDGYLDAMTIEDSAALWLRILSAPPNTTSTFVARAADEIAAFASGMMLAEPKHGADAELTAIYVVPHRQRAGLGTRLLGAVAAAQRQRGATALLTWVIAANRKARAFYESLDAELVLEQPFQWDGMDLVEAGYVWRDLDGLVAACGPPPRLH